MSCTTTYYYVLLLLTITYSYYFYCLLLPLDLDISEFDEASTLAHLAQLLGIPASDLVLSISSGSTMLSVSVGTAIATDGLTALQDVNLHALSQLLAVNVSMAPGTTPMLIVENITRLATLLQQTSSVCPAGFWSAPRHTTCYLQLTTYYSLSC